jgi:hypothetical protein
MTEAPPRVAGHLQLSYLTGDYFMATRHIYTFITSLMLSVCFISFQNFTDEDSQNETLENMQIEDEVLQTSTDDINQQQREAQEHARVAEQERQSAESKLAKTRTRRQQVEVEAKVKISQDMARRQQAIESRNRLTSETSKLEKEISGIESRIEKADREARVAREEAMKARQMYDQLRRKKAELQDVEKNKKMEKRKTGALMQRRTLASSSSEVRAPKVLPQKRTQ